jgi:ribonuclease T1
MRLIAGPRSRLTAILGILALGFAIAVGVGPSCSGTSSDSKAAQVQLDDLPKEAQNTLRLVKTQGSFPYKRDGVIFGNFEGRLPKKPRGYYKEYTVPTPGARDRGSRRIVAGQNSEYYYTNDHYQTFRRILE